MVGALFAPVDRFRMRGVIGSGGEVGGRTTGVEEGVKKYSFLGSKPSYEEGCWEREGRLVGPGLEGRDRAERFAEEEIAGKLDRLPGLVVRFASRP